MQPPHPCPLAHLHRCGGAGRIHAEQLGITSGIDRRFRPAQGQIERLGAAALQGATQLLQERLDRPGGVGIGPASGRFGGIHTGCAMHPIESLSLVVVGGEIGVADLPVGCGPLLQGQAAELALTHALQHAAPDLGVAAEGVDRLRGEGITVGAEPLLTGVVAILAEQVDVGDVLIRQRHRTAALQQQHRLAGGGQLPRQGAATGTAADHDHVVVLVVDDHRQT